MSLPSLPDVPRERRGTATKVSVAVLGVLCLLALVFGLRGLFAPAEPGPTAAQTAGSTGSTASTSASPPSTTAGAAESPSSTPSPPASAGGTAAGQPPKPAADLVTFSSPSKNIRCQLSSAGVWCSIAHREWSPGDKPAGCTTSWGHGLVLTADHAGVACAATTVPTGSTLGYGQDSVRGDFRCTSDEDGISCEHRGGEHEFELSRGDFSVR